MNEYKTECPKCGAPLFVKGLNQWEEPFIDEPLEPDGFVADGGDTYEERVYCKRCDFEANLEDVEENSCN